MSTTGKGIYHWKLGDVALARICKKVYARVRVIKDEKGLFYDDKVLAISPNADNTITTTKELCYYVETCRSKQKLWLPYTCMYLAERSRPFYGTEKNSLKKADTSPAKINKPKKRKLKEELIVPLDVKIPKYPTQDLNTTYDIRHVPLKQGKYDNAFREFVRRGKDSIFDEYFTILQTSIKENEDSIDYLLNVDASTEDKFELVIKNVVTEKEIENYLHQCWRYNFVHKQSSAESKSKEMSDITNSSALNQGVTVHISWCVVCGAGDKLRSCTACPASFHLACRKDWLLTIIHRKNPPKKPARAILIDKILSSTRTKYKVQKEKENVSLCPSCMWGPKVGYDDVVWHKLGTCSWWPARVLSPGEAPPCLLARAHRPTHWPLRYYGTLNHSWGDACRMCLFLPSHTRALESKEPMLKQAVLDACDDYITVYLT